ncbi:Hpt domain-containing protein [Paucibacter sp. hw1]|uniref:histidine kinase n=2 Tax=Roseateles koreensis TaxID=2987526 RepID=A0ABT5KMP0_9BURK|nr:Hpt domain-containing protein [Roseateles koreensis]
MPNSLARQTRVKPEAQDSEFPADLSPLAWVQEELRRSLESVHKALRRLLRDGDTRSSGYAALASQDSQPSPPLQAAAAQLHQVAGVLSLVGLPAGARVLQAAERAVANLASRPADIDLARVEIIEKADFALLALVSRMLAGGAPSAGTSSLSLFPTYRDLQTLNGAERVHPADLWQFDWHWQTLPVDPSAHAAPASEVRAPFEAALLKQMRETQASVAATYAARLSDLCAALAAGLHGAPRSTTLWQLAAAMFQAQAQGLLPIDAFVKRLGSRLLSQLRSVGQGDAGDAEAQERLARDLLFFCAQSRAPAEPGVAGRLDAVRASYGLSERSAGDYEDESLGRIDPAWVIQAKRRVSAAKESWGSVAEGETHRMAGLDEQFAGLAESLQRLFPSGAVLGEVLQRAVVSTVRAGKAPPPALAMELATSLLYVEAALDEAAFDQPEQAERVKRLAARVGAVARGEAPQPLEGWMEDLYRRVSDRQTLGSVVHELRVSLAEIERQADEYFRDPSQRERLIPVPGQLSSMRGVLTVLGLDQAALACVRMRDEVDELTNTEVDVARAAPRELFDRLANNLGALGFLIDMLGVQPALAKRMFVFDEASGRLSPLMGRSREVAEVAGAASIAPVETVPAPAPARAPVSAHAPAAAPLPSVSLAAQARPADELKLSSGDDPEMREIFLEEATEVLGQARDALNALRKDAHNREQLTVMRRAFHTLKGSSRMVGLEALGEGAWSCEQLFNARLSDPSPTADAPLISFSAMALDYLGHWCDEIASGQTAASTPDLLRQQADALRLPGATPHVAADVAALPLAPEAVPELVPDTMAELTAHPVDEAVSSGFASTELAADEPLTELAPLTLSIMPLADEVEPMPRITLVPDVHEAPVLPAVTEAPKLDEVLVLDGESGPAVLEEFAPTTNEAPDLPWVLEFATPLPEAGTAEAADFELPAFELNLESGEVFAPTVLPESELEQIAATNGDSATNEAELPALTAAQLSEAPQIELPAPVGETHVAPVLELVRSAPDSESGDLSAHTDEDNVKVIGPIRVSINLFNIFLNEADELSRRLATSLAEWALELNGPVPANCEALAHALAGNAAAVQFDDLSQLARALEHALGRAQRTRHYSEEDAQMFVQAADEVRHLLHQFAAGFLKPHDPDTVARLQAYQPEPDADFEQELDSLSMGLDDAIRHKSGQTNELAVSGSDEAPLPVPAAHEDEVEPGLPDAIEPVLFPIFDEEAQDLLVQLHGALRAWVANPQDRAQGDACMRALHTFKGGARLTGAMRLGEQAHDLESAVERAQAPQAGRETATPDELLSLQAGGDALAASLERLRMELAGNISAPAPMVSPVAEVRDLTPNLKQAAAEPVEVHDAPLHQVDAEASGRPADEPAVAGAMVAPRQETPAARIDWARFAEGPQDDGAVESGPTGLQAMVRVRGSLLERMAAQAGEVSIRRTRLESELAQMKSALLDLDDNLERLRSQMRELELQAEAQMGAQQDHLSPNSAHFDPLEFDRYTRFQELTKMLSESVGDVATVQRALQRSVQLGEDELAAQSRLTRELQDDLLRTRMVEFESVSERMHRVVRQAARDTHKQAQLTVVGGQTELDRSVLERMAGAFEHLLRNSVSHGIESAEVRSAAGKPALGQLTLSLQQEGNEVLLTFGDDGAGLDLARIRRRGEQMGLIKSDGPSPSDSELMQLIFTPGFSTAAQITETSGRGVGMDVVRAEVATLGGSIETRSQPGLGSSFTLRLPLTTALTQVVILRCGEQTVAVPAGLMDSVQRVPQEQLDQAYLSGSLTIGGQEQPFYWLGGLLGQAGRGLSHGKSASVVLLRNSQQRLALHVDEVMGNQEVVVKNLGPQLSRVPGLAGISLLANGEVALIYNPHALASWYGAAAQQRLRDLQPSQAQFQGMAAAPELAAPDLAPLVLVVDDSLTVRRVTQRLLERVGYRVQLAKDGLDAMEQLAGEELPALVLSDIEMPRMDGFDLVRNMRADERLAALPVIMITSRIAQKHRDYAQQLGVNHYLGKPYDEDLLLKLIAGYTPIPVPNRDLTAKN